MLDAVFVYLLKNNLMNNLTQINKNVVIDVWVSMSLFLKLE